MKAHIYACEYVCMYTRTYVRIYVCMQVCVCLCFFVCKLISVCTVINPILYGNIREKTSSIFSS